MFSLHRALVVDSNALSRSVLVSMLTELGFKSVAQASRPKDALQKLEQQPYDFIFCEYHFADSAYTGQVFVDDLRASKLLTVSTSFIMVTSEAHHARVAEAAESALDSYVLKPYTFNDLNERLKEVCARKEAFKFVYAELALNEFEAAATLCEDMVARRARYWVNAARIAGELRIRNGEFEAATRLFNAVAETSAVPWARLGLARVDLDRGHPQLATRALEGLLSQCPGYADAHDVMGRALVAQGDLAGAALVFKRAVALTPSSLTRLQKLGALAFYEGDRSQAESSLDKAFRIGAGSAMYDYQSLVLLSFLRFDGKRDPRFIHTAWSVMRKQVAATPSSFRLESLLEVIAVLAALQNKKLAHVLEGVSALVAKIDNPQFDFEMACNLLNVLQRVNASEFRLADSENWVARLAARFCTTKVAAKLLSQSTNQGAHIAEFEKALKTVTLDTQAALTKGLQGRSAEAVETLLVRARSTHNARILEVAILVARKYREVIPRYAEIMMELESLFQAYCSFGTHAGLVPRTQQQTKAPESARAA